MVISRVTRATGAGPGQHRSQQMMTGQRHVLSRLFLGSSLKVDMKKMMPQAMLTIWTIPIQVPTHRIGQMRCYKGANDHEGSGDRGQRSPTGPSQSLSPSGPWDLLGPRPAFSSRGQNLTVMQIHLWLDATPPY